MSAKKKKSKNSNGIKKNDLTKKINTTKGGSKTRKNTSQKTTTPKKNTSANQKSTQKKTSTTKSAKKNATTTSKKNKQTNTIQKKVKTNTTNIKIVSSKKPVATSKQQKHENNKEIDLITDNFDKTNISNKKNDANQIKNSQNKKNSFLYILGIILTYLCKGVLISVKFVKNFLIKQYNGIKRRSKRKKTINAIRRDEIETDELVLKRYRDYPIYAFLYVFLANRIKVIKFDMKNFKKKFKYGTFKDKLLIIFMMMLIVGFSLLLAFCIYIILTAPEVSEENLYRNTTTVLLDSEGKEFARIGSENRENVTYEDLPEVLIDAIVATEDSRFFQHNGIDIARFTKATIGQLLGRSDAGGGSTLTMQVSKKAATSTESHGIKGIIRKFTDIYLSVFVFEQRYTKEQIIEFYVNINFLGARTYGVEQASKIYFGKSVSELTLTEAALIAGLFQAPNAYNPYINPVGAQERRNTVLNLMYRHGYITEEERDNAQAIPVETMLVQREDNGDVNEHQGFIDTLVSDIEEQTGYNAYKTSMTVYTTYNLQKQKVINDIYETYQFQDDAIQIGIAVVDVKTGALIAVGAGRNRNAARTLNYAKLRRHPGSVAKPVLDYGPAIEYLNWSTGTTVIDDKYEYTGGGQIKNFDNGFKEIMTVKKALANSRNIPALFTFQQTTNDQKLDFAKNLGWKPETTPNGTLLESDSIGGFEGVTSIEAAAAYATFARGGIYIEPYTYTKIEFADSDDVIEHTPKKRQVMSEDTAYLINMILKYAITSNIVTAYKVSGTDIAGKTGTSTVSSAAIKSLGLKGNIVGDSWEVTYSPDYAIALWQGYEPQLTKEHYLLNSKAKKTRNDVSTALSKGIHEKNSKFKKPSGVTTAVVELETDPLQLASPFTPDNLKSTEYFKKDTVPTTVSKRFDTLENPTNLRYSSTSYSVNLAWDAAPLPDAVNQTYLQEFFNNSTVYKPWAEKYYNRRLEYNRNNIGSFGYHVYLVNANGTYDLGFTTATQFTANVQFDSMTRFVVKSSYQKFTANQSPGVSVTVAPNSQSSYIPPTQPTDKPTAENIRLSIVYKGRSSCSTLSEYNALGGSIADKITIEANGEDVTNQANININCYIDDDDNDQGGHCSEMRSDTKYRIEITAVYKNVRRMAVVNIKPNC